MNDDRYPKVVNIDVEKYDVFIGRPSKWGNPFKIEPGEYTRSESLAEYKTWIVNQADLMSQS